MIFFFRIQIFFFFFLGGGQRGGRVGGGVRVDVNEELKFLRKLKKNGGVRWGIGLVEGSGWM